MNRRAEETVLSLALKDEGQGVSLAQMIGRDEMEDAVNGRIWAAALDIYQASGHFPSVDTMRSRFGEDRAILPRLESIASIDERWELHGEHVDKIKRSFLGRRVRLMLSDALASIEKKDVNSILNEVVDQIYSLESASVRRDRTYEEAMDSAYLRLNRAIQRREAPGIPVPYANLKSFMPKGLPNGGMILVVARPSCGKTAFTKSMAFEVAKSGVPTLFCSIEMSMEQIEDILLSAHADIDLDHIYHPGSLSRDEWKSIKNVRDQASGIPLLIDESYSITIHDLYRRLNWYTRYRGVRAIFIDYAQLIIDDTVEGGKEYDVNRQISSHLRVLARQINVPVIVAAQLNREVEKRRDKHPMMSDIRGAGQWEQDAAVIIGLYRDEIYNPDSESPGIIEADILKNRFGPSGKTFFHFNKTRQIVRPYSGS